MDVELDDPNMDLLDEAVADMYIAEVRSKKFDAALMSMPCSTFSSGRTDDGGPPPLRGTSPREIYGLPGLSLKDKEKVRIGTILALRGAALAKECIVQGVPWLAETPKFREGSPSLLRLPEWMDICGRQDVNKKCISQCMLDAPTMKPTEIWGTTYIDDLPSECLHPNRSWCVPWFGET